MALMNVMHVVIKAANFASRRSLIIIPRRRNEGSSFCNKVLPNMFSFFKCASCSYIDTKTVARQLYILKMQLSTETEDIEDALMYPPLTNNLYRLFA